MDFTTVRINPQDQDLLDTLAQVHGGVSEAVSAALRSLGERHQRQLALAEATENWDGEGPPVSEAEIQAMNKHLGL